MEESPRSVPAPRERSAEFPPPETAKEEIDAELLGIFIEEASEVLHTIARNLALSRGVDNK